MVARTAYSDAKMGMANAMAYFSILLSIVFTVYFYRKLSAARLQVGTEW
jgi:multiple sugar transport system permease protein